MKIGVEADAISIGHTHRDNEVSGVQLYLDVGPYTICYEMNDKDTLTLAKALRSHIVLRRTCPGDHTAHN